MLRKRRTFLTVVVGAALTTACGTSPTHQSQLAELAPAASADPSPSAEILPEPAVVPPDAPKGDQPVVADGRLTNTVTYGDVHFSPSASNARSSLATLESRVAESGIYGDVGHTAKSSTWFFANYRADALAAPPDATNAKDETPVWVVVYHGVADVDGVTKDAAPELHDIVFIMADASEQLLRVVSTPGPS